jgi:hypothetical protein
MRVRHNCHETQSLPILTTSITVLFLPYQDTEETQQEINEGGKGKKGEFRARRAGRILDVTSDGYYHTDLCLADFKKVGLYFWCWYHQH